MARTYDHDYKVQAVKLAKEIGGDNIQNPQEHLPHLSAHILRHTGLYIACIRRNGY